MPEKLTLEEILKYKAAKKAFDRLAEAKVDRKLLAFWLCEIATAFNPRQTNEETTSRATQSGSFSEGRQETGGTNRDRGPNTLGVSNRVVGE